MGSGAPRGQVVVRHIRERAARSSTGAPDPVLEVLVEFARVLWWLARMSVAGVRRFPVPVAVPVAVLVAVLVAVEVARVQGVGVDAAIVAGGVLVVGVVVRLRWPGWFRTRVSLPW